MELHARSSTSSGAALTHCSNAFAAGRHDLACLSRLIMLLKTKSEYDHVQVLVI